jgi:microcompartment protein CcmL/EutN
MNKPAIGIVELNSVAAGIFSTDAMVKKAKVKVLKSSPVCAGKYVILINGDEADVAESMKSGLETAGNFVVDNIIIYNIHPFIAPAILGISEIGELDSIGVLETFSVASTIIAADAAAKESSVKLISIRLANGLGGKSYFTMTGELSDVQASMERAKDTVEESGMYVNDRIIPIPHEDMAEVLL